MLLTVYNGILLYTTNFQKKLIATANVLKNEKPYPCKIYQLEKGIDSDYFTRQGRNGRSWISLLMFAFGVSEGTVQTGSGFQKTGIRSRVELMNFVLSLCVGMV